MAIHVVCAHCGAEHNVNQRFAGKRVRCPQCESAVEIPALIQTVEPVVSVEPVETDDDIPTVAVQKPNVFQPVVAEAVPVDAVPLDTVPVDAVPVDAVPEQTVEASPFLDDDDDEVPKREKKPEEELDMTPMVDVTFLLLIFFMVTASFSLQKSIEMPRQQSDAASNNPEEEEEEVEAVEVQIDDRGSFLVISPAGEKETIGKQNLLVALKAAYPGGAEIAKLDVKVHEAAKLQALVDAMDAGTIAGYAELKVTQVEEFD